MQKLPGASPPGPHGVQPPCQFVAREPPVTLETNTILLIHCTFNYQSKVAL